MTNTSDDLVDVTDELFASLKSITNNKVVQSPFFDLLEGTRAVEVNNEKLDTGLIPLTDADLSFDPSSGQSAELVIGVMNRLIVLYLSWINKWSLSVTVLSCRYAQTLLENYMANPERFSNVTLINGRLPNTMNGHELTIEHILVNKVLRSFVGGLCKFIGITLEVGLSVLYEEEDLITRSMDLDFLSKVSAEEIIDDIDSSIEWIQAQNSENLEFTIMKDYLFIVKGLLNVRTVLAIPVDLFLPKVSFDVNFIEDLAQNFGTMFKTISTSENKYEKTPEGSFSRFVQLDLNNKSIPSELHALPVEEVYKGFEKMLRGIYDFVIDSYKISNFNQLDNYLKYNIAYDISEGKLNVFARGLFQLYLIRDDKSIMGSDENLSSLSIKYMENLSCFDSKILQQHKWDGFKNGTEATRAASLTQYEQLLTDIESGIFLHLTTFASNRCRQRQLMNRSILVWDTIQVAAENFEVGMYNEFGISDPVYLMDGTQRVVDEPLLAISSFVYYIKLQTMMEVALSGFELDLYKPFEISQMYWYISYLAQLIIEHLEVRVNRINRLKMYHITTVLPQRISLGLASQRKALKMEEAELKQFVLPALTSIDRYNNDGLVKLYKGLQLMSEAVRMQFVIFEALGINSQQKKILTSRKALFGLRMKPWSSIGVPALPTFEQFETSMLSKFLDDENFATKEEKYAKVAAILKVISGKLAESRKMHDAVAVFAKNSGNFVGSTSAPEWHQKLSKTCVLYAIVTNSLAKLVQQPGFDGKAYVLKVDPGYHMYFPKFTVKKRD